MYKPKHFIFYVGIVFLMLMSMVFPSSALADEDTPTESPPVTTEVTGEVTEGNHTPEPTDTIVGNTSPENTPTPEALESISELAEIVEEMQDVGLILTDQNGNPIPLATEVAKEALLAPDPIGCPPGIEPVSWGGTGAGCTVSYASIQDAINDVNVVAGWTIYIDPGTFSENVAVNKSLTLQGSGVGVTIVHPGNSSTTNLGCGPGSCASTTNSVFYITADNVTIRDLTVDGDNTSVASGVVVNGVDINARNGIFGNSVDNLTVEDTEVKNVYLRGIQVTYSNSFEIKDNTLQNVDGSIYSISVFNFGGGGIIDGNTITQTGDGIASNWSTGTQILNNTISDMGTGIHTDNTGGADLISGNTISNGRSNSYGIFVFAPYEVVSVTNNTINNVDVGLTVSGNGYGDTLNTINFSDNQVTTNLIGAYVTSDVWGYFFSDVSAEFNNNVFTGGDFGFYLESSGSGENIGSASSYSYDCADASGDCTLNVTGSGNSITGQNVFAATIAEGDISWFSGVVPVFYGIYNVDLQGNWWGDASGPNESSLIPDSCGLSIDNPSGLGGDVSKCILYDLWLTSDPFPLPPTPGGGGSTGGGTTGTTITSIAFTTFIPVTGGTAFNISCPPESFKAEFEKFNIIFNNLCDHQGIVEILDSSSALPGSLPAGNTFISGFTVNVAKSGQIVNLPSTASLTLDFVRSAPDQTFIILSWDGSKWNEVDGQKVGDFHQTTVDYTGTFVLVTK